MEQLDHTGCFPVIDPESSGCVVFLRDFFQLVLGRAGTPVIYLDLWLFQAIIAGFCRQFSDRVPHHEVTQVTFSGFHFAKDNHIQGILIVQDKLHSVSCFFQFLRQAIQCIL